MQRVQVTPRSYPTNLIDKDWSKRKHFHWNKDAQVFLNLVHGMEIREDDVWIVTLPKCGTTWMQELLWLLLNDCDFEEALSKDQELRSPFLEFNLICNNNAEQALKFVHEFKSPRLIKSHLPLALLPSKLWKGKNKVIYVFRNPLDASVSQYYHNLNWGFAFGKTLEEFVEERVSSEDFITDTIAHAHEFCQLRKEPWVFYTSFERMKKDLRGVINEVSTFLNKPVSEEQMERLLKHLSFEEMKKNPTTNHRWEQAQLKLKDAGKEKHNFIRKGQVNGYKDELKPEQIKKANERIQKSLKDNSVTMEELLLAVEVSTFLALSSLEEGPVCVICTRRSVEGGGSFFMGAVMVNRPSEEREEVTVSGLTSPGKVISLGENCWTSRITSNFSLSMCSPLVLPKKTSRLLLLLLFCHVQAHLSKRSYSDQSVHGYMTERTCWWNEVCKEEFQSLFRCKCPQFSYCRSPGRYYNAYCSMTDTGYIWTQPNWDWGA
ncbi:sulfotransferase 1 family member D1-like [Drosophila kikkawai]|uniref:Sulfotransferase 1 family member D1-like n=1 Tax=Drosophila kikkawai TaxID=30033 RepID=A0ABM4GCS1_DROKI